LKYLLDTNIISELIKDNPNENVVSFIKSINEDAFVLSVVTVGEIKFGIENSKSEAKKEELKNWLYNHLLQRFENKIIDIDIETILIWAKTTHKLQTIGKPMPIMDSLIAATCLAKNLILVTRNEKDFNALEIELINPFEIAQK
jgi:toxin FitB